MSDVYKRGSEAWAGWEYELARVAARKRDKDEEFQALALVR